MFRFISICIFLIPGLAFAQEPILFPRTPDISPDAKTVAFSYLGDIWAVDATGAMPDPLPCIPRTIFNPHLVLMENS